MPIPENLVYKLSVELIEEIYAAALDPNLWSPFILKIKEHLQADHALLIHKNLKTGESCQLAPEGSVDPSYIEAYDDYFGRINPLIFYLDQKDFQPGHVAIDSRRMPIADFEKTEFYSDFFSKYDLKWGMGTTIARTEDSMDFIALASSGQRPDFNQYDMQLLQLLAPHLNRAFQISLRLKQSSIQRDLSFHTLNQASFGVLFLDPKGKIIYTNQKAKHFLDKGDGLNVKQFTLHASRPDEDNHLQCIIKAAANFQKGPTQQAAETLKISRLVKNQYYNLCVFPVLVETEEFTQSLYGKIGVFISDSESQLTPSRHLLQKHYSLTPTEAEVAALLLKDSSPKDIADRLCISLHTVRAHIRSIFRKTGINRQSALAPKTLSELPTFLLFQDS